ncbi:MAG TPA: hypothetical protein PLS49_09615 [Candidatus Woesebacteria bacterium]|nr:hypothetical protein [Candidatus Woesebacteria bacterium]
MSSEFDPHRLYSRYTSPKSVTPYMIQQQLNQSGEFSNGDDRLKPIIKDFFTRNQFAQVIQGYEYIPQRNKQDIIVYLNTSTFEGSQISDRIGYDTVTVNFFKNEKKAASYIDASLHTEFLVDRWYSDKRIVLEEQQISSNTLNRDRSILDFYFQMWILSDNLYNKGAGKQFMTFLDPSTQLLMSTNNMMYPIVAKRRPIIDAFYNSTDYREAFFGNQYFDTDIYRDTHAITKEFSLT